MATNKSQKAGIDVRLFIFSVILISLFARF